MKILLPVSILFSVFLVQTQVFAQTFSYDGNRWYEIEVSIFTNQSARSANQELFLPAYVELFYPEPNLRLTPLIDAYSIDFTDEPVNEGINEGGNAEIDDEINTVAINANFLQTTANEREIIGPVFREPNRDYRLIDKARDPFIALGEEEHEFARFNRNIEQSPDHRILFHAVWRQPVLNKIQASAIVIHGGDRFGLHHELEGSLLISYNINRVDIDANIWRNSFNISSEQAWNVPLPPLSPLADIDENEFIGIVIDQVYPMLETRQMISNELHYLDHPALGMLIEVRPYELPPLFDFSLE